MRLVAILMTSLLASASMHGPAVAQDPLSVVDLESPEMSEAEMTRADVEKILDAATPDKPADFTAKRLSGLDLSGLDFSKAVLRSARLNKTKLVGAKFVDAVLDQAWLLKADLTGADMRGAHMFQGQFRGAKMDGVDLSNARVASDLTKASLKGAKFVSADLGADMRNQSMGLMRGILKSADLEGADFTGANLSRVDLEFATLKGANLSNANMMSAQLGGADLTGANVKGANFNKADVSSTTLKALVSAESTNLKNAKNLESAFRD